MLQSSRLLLRALELNDLNSTYLGWLNDPIVNCFWRLVFFPRRMNLFMLIGSLIAMILLALGLRFVFWLIVATSAISNLVLSGVTTALPISACS